MNYRNIYLKFDKTYQTLRTIRDFHRDKIEMKNASARMGFPELTAKEKNEIDTYWKEYGIKFKDYYTYQYFYGMTGIRSPKFIHNSVHGHIVVPYYNARNATCYYQTYTDKNFLYDFFPDLNFPEPVLKKVDGRYYLPDNKCLGIDLEKAIKVLLAETEVISKPAIESEAGQGRNVQKYMIRSRSDAERVLADKENVDNMIVQRVLRQHRFFSQFNDSSVNLIRINTWCHDGIVDIYTPVLRFGYSGNFTDIIHVDGIEDFRAVGITLDGHLRHDVFSYATGEKWDIREFTQDPNERVPCWNEIITMLKVNAPKARHIGIIGWDITVSEDEKPIVIELNAGWTGIQSSQFCGGPAYGDMTDDMLAFLKNERNQMKYIPFTLRA